MTQFDELLLDPFYSAESSGGPEWATVIIRAGEGGSVSYRNENREDYVSRYEIELGELSKERKKNLRAFALLRRGMARGFRFLAPDDSELIGENVGFYNAVTGNIDYVGATNGVQSEFVAIKNYSDPFVSFNRRICKLSPYQDFFVRFYPLSSPQTLEAEIAFPAQPNFNVFYQAVPEYVNTTFLNYGLTSVTLNYWLGKITFSPAPPANKIIRISGEYHLPVAFADDWQKYSIDEAGIGKFVARLDELLPVELGIN